jgi:hypothetical protein
MRAVIAVAQQTMRKPRQPHLFACEEWEKKKASAPAGTLAHRTKKQLD